MSPFHLRLALGAALIMGGAVVSLLKSRPEKADMPARGVKQETHNHYYNTAAEKKAAEEKAAEKKAAEEKAATEKKAAEEKGQ